MGKIVPVKVGNFLEVFNGNARTLYRIIDINQPCPACGGNDYITMEVPANNDEGQSDGYYTVIDNKVGYKIKVCEKNLYEEVRNTYGNDFVMIPESLNADIERRILWDNNENDVLP